MAQSTITAAEITQHRLRLAPPFDASRDTQPRTSFDATIVRVHTDAGITGTASGDTMLGFAGHEPLFVGEAPGRGFALDEDRLPRTRVG